MTTTEITLKSINDERRQWLKERDNSQLDEAIQAAVSKENN